MPQVRPFRALHYDPSRVGDLAQVVTQPYDRISPKLQEEYYRRHPCNAVRLELARGERYRAAREALAEWLASRVLVEGAEPAFHVVAVDYTTPQGERRTRRGIAAMVLAEEFGRGRVLPHEHTHEKPKEDRLLLLGEARAHFSPVFLLYRDPARKLAVLVDRAMSRPPDLEARDDFGFVHRAWRISDPRDVREIQRDLERREAIIADGHHRYETAVRFRREHGPGKGDRPHDYVLATLVNADEPGLTILGTHRGVRGLEDFDGGRLVEGVRLLFEVREYVEAGTDFFEDLRFEGYGRTALGLLVGGHPVRLLIDSARRFAGRLDVSVLHEEVLRPMLDITPRDTQAERYVDYHRDGVDLARRVAAGEYQAAFLLNPVPMNQIEVIVQRGGRLPQKSTDFHPKMISGFLMARLDGWMG